MILVKDEELFPADLMCLYSNLAENVCFIKTTNLDGETNLKIKKPVDLKGLALGPPDRQRDTPPQVCGAAGPGRACRAGGAAAVEASGCCRRAGQASKLSLLGAGAAAPSRQAGRQAAAACLHHLASAPPRTHLCVLLPLAPTHPHPQADYLRRAMELNLTLTAEDANKNLHKFRGRAEIRDGRLADLPLSSSASASAIANGADGGGGGGEGEEEVSSAPAAAPAGGCCWAAGLAAGGVWGDCCRVSWGAACAAC